MAAGAELRGVVAAAGLRVLAVAGDAAPRRAAEVRRRHATIGHRQVVGGKPGGVRAQGGRAPWKRGCSQVIHRQGNRLVCRIVSILLLLWVAFGLKIKEIVLKNE